MEFITCDCSSNISTQQAFSKNVSNKAVVSYCHTHVNSKYWINYWITAYDSHAQEQCDMRRANCSYMTEKIVVTSNPKVNKTPNLTLY